VLHMQTIGDGKKRRQRLSFLVSVTVNDERLKVRDLCACAQAQLQVRA